MLSNDRRLLLAERGHPIGLVRNNLIRRDVFGRLVGACKPNSTIHEQYCSAILYPGGPMAGEVINMMRQPADDRVQLSPGHLLLQSFLSDTTILEVKHGGS